MRNCIIERNTNETKIFLMLNLDGNGKSDVDTGSGFLNHMLTLFSAHGGFDLEIKCVGDKEVDYHHSVEDIGICLGQAFKECLGDKRGIKRYGGKIIPMDEALILTSVDFSGRSYLNFGVRFECGKVGEFDTELVEEFFLGFTRKAEATLHIVQFAGSNTHHVIEAIFKSVARSISEACEKDVKNPDAIPSTKGSL